MKISIKQYYIIIAVICNLSSCISLNDSVITNSTYLTKNNFKYIGTVYGESQANYFFFIGGNLKNGQAKEAYENMKANANLKEGQAFVNIILDYKRTYFLSNVLNGWGQIKAIISADIVQFRDEEYQTNTIINTTKQEVINKKIIDEDFENYLKQDIKNEKLLDETSIEGYNSKNEYHVIRESKIERVVNRKGKENASYSFNGSSSYIKFSNFCINNIHFVNFWIKPSANNFENKQQLFIIGPSKNNEQLGCRIENQTLYFDRKINEIKTEASISLKGKSNVYSMLSINILDNGELKLYLNSQLVSKSSIPSENSKDTCEKNTLTFGSDKFFTGDFYGGLIEDFQISKETKDITYINNIYIN